MTHGILEGVHGDAQGGQTQISWNQKMSLTKVVRYVLVVKKKPLLAGSPPPWSRGHNRYFLVVMKTLFLTVYGIVLDYYILWCS